MTGDMRETLSLASTPGTPCGELSVITASYSTVTAVIIETAGEDSPPRAAASVILDDKAVLALRDRLTEWLSQ